MDKMNFENVDKYLIDRIIEVKGVESFLTVETTQKPERVELYTIAREFKFKTQSGVILKVTLLQEGYLSIFFVNEKEKNAFFSFRRYLEKFDKEELAEHDKRDNEIRKEEDFMLNLNFAIDSFSNYLKNSEELQAVLRGKKWFDILIDFGGMK